MPTAAAKCDRKQLPCQSPYCECSAGNCSRTGYFDARGSSIKLEDREFYLVRDRRVVASADRADMLDNVYVPGDVVCHVIKRY